MKYVKAIFSKFKGNTSAILLLLLVVVVLLDLLTLKRSAQIIYSALYGDPGAKPSVSVRVNFEGYNAAVKRIEGAKDFAPADPVKTNPFAQPSSSKKTQ